MGFLLGLPLRLLGLIFGLIRFLIRWRCWFFWEYGCIGSTADTDPPTAAKRMNRISRGRCTPWIMRMSRTTTSIRSKRYGGILEFIPHPHGGSH